MATITALLISLLFGGKVIRKLRDLKFGQEIREEALGRTSGEKGHADDGRRFDNWLGFSLDGTLGEARQLISVARAWVRRLCFACGRILPTII